MTEDRARLHTAVLVAPSKGGGSSASSAARPRRGSTPSSVRTALAAAKAKAEQGACRARRATIYLPKAGEPGAAAAAHPGRFI